MEEQEFEKLVEKGLLKLPLRIRQKLKNIAVCIEPEKEIKKKNKIVLGLYQGVPKNVWARDANVLPDKITIFQKPIVSIAQSSDKIEELVSEVVWHEIAHHFGFDEDGIKNIKHKKTT